MSISTSDDIIDSRDVLERIKELEGEYVSDDDLRLLDREVEGSTDTFDDLDDEELKKLADDGTSEAEELITLRALEEEIDNNAGENCSDGVTLIRDSYFIQYAEQLADDIGAIDSNAGWPLNCIDWEKAADELKSDYTSIDYDGAEYWVRS